MMFIHPLFLGKIGLTEILVILLIVVIFFGGKKIPELMRGMGRGVREFKDAMENPAAGDDKNGKEQAAPQESRKETPEEKKKSNLPTFFYYQRMGNLNLLICAACGISFRFST